MRTALFTRFRRILPLLAIAVPVVIVAFVATRLTQLPFVESVLVSLKSARDDWWALPLFLLAYATFAMLLMPVGLLSAMAALVWGWKVGGAIDLLAATLGALPPFLMARYGLARWIERRLSRDDVPVLDSPFVLFLLRVLPIVPYVALNYIAGSATRIRTRDYVIVTLFGSVPSAFLFAFFVDTMAAGAIGAATEAKIFGVCALIALVAILLRMAAQRVVRRA